MAVKITAVCSFSHLCVLSSLNAGSLELHLGRDLLSLKYDFTSFMRTNR